ncbi:MAG: hypothetical protein ACYTX0_42345 [Nostoc sp.]
MTGFEVLEPFYKTAILMLYHKTNARASYFQQNTKFFGSPVKWVFEQNARTSKKLGFIENPVNDARTQHFCICWRKVT